jgi:hypothetical protein
MTMDIVIGDTPVRGSVAVDGPRFADLAMQVGGFVFGSDHKHITSLRWVPSKEPPYTQIVASAGGDELRCTPSARSLPFIVPYLTRAISVLLVLSHEGLEKRYDLGDYAFQTTTESDTLILHRTSVQSPTDGTNNTIDAAVVEPPSPRPGDDGDQPLEDQYRNAFRLWGIDGLFDTVTFHVAEATDVFRPTAMLFEVIGDALLVWCGNSNRFGPSVLFVVGQAPPTPSYFTHLRTMARVIHFPVLLGHGRPLLDTTMQPSGQMSCILFRPGDGAAQYVRFTWDASLLRMVIVPTPFQAPGADTNPATVQILL